MIRARLFNQKEKESFMITLKKKRNHEFGNELKDRLESLVVAFKTEEIAESAEDDLYIVDGGKKISGRENLESWLRSEEHTSELQSRGHLVCRLLLETKKRKTTVNEVI